MKTSMYTIEVTPEAKDEIWEIVSFIFSDNPFYANQVLDYIYNSVKLLIEYPYVWTEMSHKYRYIRAVDFSNNTPHHDPLLQGEGAKKNHILPVSF